MGNVGCDLNGDLLPQINELGSSNGFAFGNLNRYEEGYDWPWAREYSAEIQRQLPANMVISAGYTRREKLGNFGSRNVAVPESTYQQMTVTEVNSGKTVTVYNQDPALRDKQDFVWTNAPELDSTYNGMDITLDKRMSNGWMMTGGISIGEDQRVGRQHRSQQPELERVQLRHRRQRYAILVPAVGLLRAAVRAFR